jgi:small subunit ribosomal protein S16
VGAQPSDRVARLLSSLSLVDKPTWRETPKKSAVGKKRSERAEAKAAKLAAAAAPTEDAAA